MKTEAIKLFSSMSISGVVVYLFGEISAPLEALFIIMAVDYFSGLAKGLATKTLSSKKGFEGLLKKFATLFIVVLANFVGQLINQPVLRDMACLFYIANEGLSIIENAIVLGVPCPEWLKDKLINIKNENDKEKEDKDNES